MRDATNQQPVNFQFTTGWKVFALAFAIVMPLTLVGPELGLFDIEDPRLSPFYRYLLFCTGGPAAWLTVVTAWTFQGIADNEGIRARSYIGTRDYHLHHFGWEYRWYEIDDVTRRSFRFLATSLQIKGAEKRHQFVVVSGITNVGAVLRRMYAKLPRSVFDEKALRVINEYSNLPLESTPRR